MVRSVDRGCVSSTRFTRSGEPCDYSLSSVPTSPAEGIQLTQTVNDPMSITNAVDEVGE